MQHVHADANSQQTNTELIAAPGAGKKVVIHGFFFSSDSAIQFLVKHGSTTFHSQWVAAGGGSWAFPNTPLPPWDVVPANTAVTYSTSAPSNVVIECWYKEVVDV